MRLTQPLEHGSVTALAREKLVSSTRRSPQTGTPSIFGPAANHTSGRGYCATSPPPRSQSKNGGRLKPSAVVEPRDMDVRGAELDAFLRGQSSVRSEADSPVRPNQRTHMTWLRHTNPRRSQTCTRTRTETSSTSRVVDPRRASSGRSRKSSRKRRHGSVQLVASGTSRVKSGQPLPQAAKTRFGEFAAALLERKLRRADSGFAWKHPDQRAIKSAATSTSGSIRSFI